jgi:glycosyltransferase involved in cell wall biosynthesis
VKREIFILVPSFRPTGPVKGALALANALSNVRSVTVASLKAGPGADARVEPGVRLVELEKEGAWPARIAAYRRLLRGAGGRAGAASISFCFSADIVNLMCRRDALVCSSVRGNLLRNYRFDYGPAGVVAAWLHLVALRWMDRVVAMTRSMAAQIAGFLGRTPDVIGNFIDEAALEPYRRVETPTGPYRFVFVGSLSRRKRPDLVVRAAADLKARGVQARIDLLGSGALSGWLQRLVDEVSVKEMVYVAGHVVEPYTTLASADCLVLPSHAEGVSRAILEALYLGVPCVARHVDGIAELITQGSNGVLFDNDGDLADAMLRAATLARQRATRRNLLPAGFAQKRAAMQYLELVEG